jgi:mannose-1-phosphate guanylyltransferase/mannose-6-phosphate isomerase
MQLIPVILSGGSGTRLWPVSRENYPKQFCEFFDQSFLKNSIDRVREYGTPYIITLQSMDVLTERALNELKISKEFAVYEPMGKNTAPAVALMCHILSQKGITDEVVGIFPADHLISDLAAFRSATDLAITEAKTKKIVTLGISPGYAATGYGYIEINQKPKRGETKAYKVEAFREKPDRKAAEAFLQSGRHFWNAGIFFFRVDHMIELMKKHLPQMWAKIESVHPDRANIKYAYATLDGISLDYGIMEKISEIACIPCDIGWSDVGSWDEIARLAEDANDLKWVSNATVFTENAENNFIYSMRPKVVGLVGVEGLIVVETPDALLIVKKNESQKVKALVEAMRAAKLPQVVEHPEDFN